MTTTNSATEAIMHNIAAAASSSPLPTHTPTPLSTLRTDLQSILDRLQAYHWSAHFATQTKRIYGSGTHDLRTVVTSTFIDHPTIDAARAAAWTQFETVMDRYVNAGGRGTTTTERTWMAGLKVAAYDTDVSNAQLEVLARSLLAVKADVDSICGAVVAEGGREWWVVPGPMAQFATETTASGLGVFRFENPARHTVAMGAPPRTAGVYYPTYTSMPEVAGAPVDEVVEEERSPWTAFLEEEAGFESTADCMTAMMDDETFLERRHWTVVNI